MSRPGRVALATSRQYRAADDDLAPLVRALAEAGINATPEDWDDAGRAWEAYDLVVIRSTWNYLDDVEAFLAWTHTVSAVVPVLNPPAMVEWNVDKTYLRDLEGASLPTVPTLWITPGDELPPLPWPDLVVKPSRSAGARLTARTDRHGTPAAVRALHRRGLTAMVQPYLDCFDTDGEIDTVVIGNKPSHAVRKAGVLAPGHEAQDGYHLAMQQRRELVDLGGAPTDIARAVVDHVTGALGTPLYARVDCVRLGDGTTAILEVELIEPALFLDLAPGSATVLARAIAAELRRSPS